MSVFSGQTMLGRSSDQSDSGAKLFPLENSINGLTKTAVGLELILDVYRECRLFPNILGCFHLNLFI
jgi:hypothetical protein